MTLEFDLEEDYTVVTATSVLTPKAGAAPLVLDGRDSFMELVVRRGEGKRREDA